MAITKEKVENLVLQKDSLPKEIEAIDIKIQEQIVKRNAAISKINELEAERSKKLSKIEAIKEIEK